MLDSLIKPAEAPAIPSGLREHLDKLNEVSQKHARIAGLIADAEAARRALESDHAETLAHLAARGNSPESM